MDVHLPYDPPEAFRGLYTQARGLRPLRVNGPAPADATPPRVAYSRDLYDEEIRAWDASFGDLMTRADARGLLRDTVVVVVADHGEEFDEHAGLGHGFTTYEEVLRVPLVIVHEGALPGGRMRPDLVGLVDLLPTLCTRLGVEPPAGLDGADLFARRTGDQRSSRTVYSETFEGARPRSLRNERARIVWNDGPETWEYYRVDRDPGEHDDLYGDAPPPEARSLANALKSFITDAGPDPDRSAGPDPETLEELRSLGYVE
jgi:arylsulfatase A-like enzyme